jgi:hypothetical protein
MRRSVRAVNAQADRPTDGSDAALMDAISRGSVPAFVALYDRTSAAVGAMLATLPTGAGRPAEIFAASYLEVWWLAGCHTEPGVDAVAWITDIVRRRIAEARIDPGIVENPRPDYAQLELTELLRGPVPDPIIGR